MTPATRIVTVPVLPITKKLRKLKCSMPAQQEPLRKKNPEIKLNLRNFCCRVLQNIPRNMYMTWDKNVYAGNDFYNSFFF